MVYKRLWKKIGYILSDTSKWRVREHANVTPNPPANHTTGHKEGFLALYAATEDHETVRKRDSGVPDAAVPEVSQESSEAHTAPPRSLSKAETFHVSDSLPGWALDVLNNERTPITLDSLDLNEARLACREAMTLITEEASRLVNHPELAYADYDSKTKQTRMKRPIYPYPEILRNRLPTFIRNDVAEDAFAHDAAAALTKTYAHNNDLFCHIVGDAPNPDRKYRPFTSLELSEKHDNNHVTAISIHGHHHHHLSPSRFSKTAQDAIGVLGFRFLRDETNGRERQADRCTEHYGTPSYDRKSVKSLELYKSGNVNAPMPLASAAKQQGQAVRSLLTNLPAADSAPKTRASLPGAGQPDVSITRIDISYVPGSGRIAGIVFYDVFNGAAAERLAWRQWGMAGNEPHALVTVKQSAPGVAADGRSWRFVGMAGDWDHSIWGDVLARVSGVWRKV
ncbi:hypothetical protein NA57DRAFT_82045 [Rhizodiscina lignyota]|uniref:Uncharacterized protein n=1 Tax=Rhizodiscina lignyota TaxID=1504668 RepID=A0A9P4M0U4_9PEZI|nr:hypothetical protein NA57DRAFT_82045 [Rhizodiscina lignyota]